MVRRWEWHFALLALGCFSALFLLAKATDTTLPATDAADHAALAMQATALGWIPHFPIGGDSIARIWGAGYNDHPFVPFVLMGKLMRLFGPTAWSAKLLPCLLSVGCVLEVAWLGILLRSRLTGILAALMLALTRPFWIDALNNHLDNAMSFFILASFIAWERRRPLLAGALAGVGLWFKTPVAFLLFPTFALAAVIRGNWGPTLRKLALAFLVAALTGAAMWAVVGFTGGWEWVRDYWTRQFWGTAVGGRAGAQSSDPLIFFRTLKASFVPWSLFVIWALAWASWRGRLKRPGVLIPLCAVTVLAVAISSIRFKYGHYFAPAYPFLCLLAAQPLVGALQRFETTVYRGLAAATLVLATFLVCTPVEPSPESFPALRKFVPYIQGEGSCADRVLFVRGAHPYAGDGDYEHLVAFYTGRKLLSFDCTEAGAASRDPAVRWILVSGPELRGCLGAEARAGFGRVYRYRDEYLLGRGPAPARAVTDLTPLGRELLAVTDCRAPELPQNRYEGPLGESAGDVR
jgi:hypothetical protein